MDQILSQYSPWGNKTNKFRVFDKTKSSLVTTQRSGNFVAPRTQVHSPTVSPMSLLSHSRRLAALGESSSNKHMEIPFPAIPSAQKGPIRLVDHPMELHGQ